MGWRETKKKKVSRPPRLLPSHLEQLHVRVEQVAFRHVDALRAQFVHEAEDARRDHGLAARARRRKGARRRGGLEHDAVQGGDVELVALGAGGHVERKARAGEHRRRGRVHGRLHLVQHRVGVFIDDLAALLRDVEVGQGAGEWRRGVGARARGPPSHFSPPSSFSLTGTPGAPS